MEAQTKRVLASLIISRICQDNPAGHGARSQEETQIQTERWEKNIPDWTGIKFSGSLSVPIKRWRVLASNLLVVPPRSVIGSFSNSDWSAAVYTREIKMLEEINFKMLMRLHLKRIKLCYNLRIYKLSINIIYMQSIFRAYIHIWK